jgi:hypothetical protein
MRRVQVKSDDVIGVEVAKSDSLGGFAHQTAPNYQRVNACTLPFAAVKSAKPLERSPLRTQLSYIPAVLLTLAALRLF